MASRARESRPCLSARAVAPVWHLLSQGWVSGEWQLWHTMWHLSGGLSGSQIAHHNSTEEGCIPIYIARVRHATHIYR